MSKKIQKLIKKTRHQLMWKVAEITGPEVDTLEIVSDHAAHIHTIHVPTRNVREIEYLHELAHATLCEQVHPQFSTQYFSGIDQETLASCKPACQSASDWFADEWLMQICPDEERREIEEHASMVIKHLQSTPLGNPDMLYGAALMIAQAEKYCNRKTKCGGMLGQAVAAFLSVEPSNPTLEKLETLINKLLAVTCQGCVNFTKNGDWEISR